MRHIFLINPCAGKKNAAQRVYAMAERLRRRHGLDCACMLSDRPGGAETLARSLAQRGEGLRLYACGGDGTVNEVANGIAGFDNAAMTVIPMGTGNDFLKNFGPDAEKFSDAENLWDGDLLELDMIECGGRRCLTIACTGIDARVAENVHRFSALPLLSGRGSYLASVGATFLLQPIAQRWTVTLDGQEQQGDFALAAVCNGRHYGGGSTPVPQARMDDGVLHTILVKKLSKVAFARLFSAYSAGDHAALPPELIQLSTAKTVSIRAERELTTCLDGECQRAHAVTFTLAAEKLRFFVPRGADPNATAR